MSNARAKLRLRGYQVATFLLIAVVAHLATVWLVPRVIMHRLMNGPAMKQMPVEHGVVFPPPVDASSRRIVMPSPDLLYALCVVDLTAGPLRVRADPRLDAYWSIALYAANSDAFFVLNDRQAGGSAVDLWVVPEDGRANQPPVPPGARVVISPTRQGVLLMRVLVRDTATAEQQREAARRSLRCEPTPASSG